MKKNKMIITVDEWLQTLAEENANIIASFAAHKDQAKTRKILTLYIKHYIELLITDALEEKPSGTTYSNKEMLDLTQKNLAEIKNDVQIQVAESFTKAMKKFSGQDLDYYCVVKVAPVGLNKLPC